LSKSKKKEEVQNLVQNLLHAEMGRCLAANQGKIGKKDLIWGAPYKNISKFHEHKY
jgi:hypothetical protein